MSFGVVYEKAQKGYIYPGSRILHEKQGEGKVEEK